MAYFGVMIYLLLVKSLVIGISVKGDTSTCNSRYDSNTKFNIIMTANNGDADFCKVIAEFINKCFNKRDNLEVHRQSTKAKAS